MLLYRTSNLCLDQVTEILPAVCPSPSSLHTTEEREEEDGPAELSWSPHVLNTLNQVVPRYRTPAKGWSPQPIAYPLPPQAGTPSQCSETIGQLRIINP